MLQYRTPEVPSVAPPSSTRQAAERPTGSQPLPALPHATCAWPCCALCDVSGPAGGLCSSVPGATSIKESGRSGPIGPRGGFVACGVWVMRGWIRSILCEISGPSVSRIRSGGTSREEGKDVMEVGSSCGGGKGGEGASLSSRVQGLRRVATKTRNQRPRGRVKKVVAGEVVTTE